MMRRCHVALALAAVVAVSASSCSMLPGGSSDGYHLSAYFSRAVALYPHSAVKVMGVDAGTTDSVNIEKDNDKCDSPDTKDVTETDCIRVEMTIKKNVPLPKDVTAMITPLTLIGERNVVLSPAWKQGTEKAVDGQQLDVNHTGSSVEPDDALRAFTDLAKAIDPDQVHRLVSGAAEAIDGKGDTFNSLLGQAAGVSSTLAKQDDRIIEVANNLHQVVSGLNARDTQVGQLIDSLAQASGVLADQRQSLSSLLSSAVKLTDVGSALIGAYQDQLPGDVAILTKLGYVLEANIDPVLELIAAFPVVSNGLVRVHNPRLHALEMGVAVPGSVEQILRESLDFLGVATPVCTLLGTLLPELCP